MESNRSLQLTQIRSAWCEAIEPAWGGPKRELIQTGCRTADCIREPLLVDETTNASVQATPMAALEVGQIDRSGE